MDKTFDAAAAEPRIYQTWETEGCFRAGVDAEPGAETFCIVIPPPNVTGSLHMGHALNNTLQDILIRWHRMRGHDVLWQPGTDHAGIATQMVVERKLASEGNTSRREMGREAFIERVWQQKAESEGVILGQLKRLGASCDWSRTEFTMSETLSNAVLKVFVELYNKGLIYRGKRLVNWDPAFETAISDLEVENIETDGHMWHFKYPLAGGATYEYVEKDEDGQVTLRETRDYISIATTRPETMLGDGAVAVHPSDERYAPIVGTLCEIPVGPKAHRRLIPIITDPYPDPEFGSGAVKITGAHDFNDYGVAKRGGIPCYRLMDTKAAMREDGAPYAEEAAKAQAIALSYKEKGAAMSEAEIDAINLVPDQYRGLDRFEARKRVVADVTAEGLAVMTAADDPRLGAKAIKAAQKAAEAGTPLAPVPLVEAKKIMQPFGDRSKVVIEPMLTDQWFVDAETLAAPALAAVKDGTTKFVPEAWERTYFQWLENIEPWCISRQLWWGHQIPVWYAPGVAYSGPTDDMVEAELDFENLRLFCASEFDAAREIGFESVYRDAGYGDYRPVEYSDWTEWNNLEPDEKRGIIPFVRDPDVLDTWFSSALWPFSTLGWPEETPELQRYYKTDVLITGFDIIFFWVARMMMAGLEFMKDGEGRSEVPFHTVYVHALVRDEHGKKMSKSLGNVIDPLELIDEYGADAVRMTLTSMAAMGRDIKLAVGRVAGYRNFSTKLWNAARFAEMNGCKPVAFDPASPRETVNRWIVGETVRVAKATDEALAAYRFNDAANGLYGHVWGVFCDWYLEFAKPLLAEGHPARAETQATMAWALDQCLVLLHPIMPFVTEELWQQTGARDGRLMLTRWPALPDTLVDEAASREIGWVIRAVEQIRSVRAEMNVPGGAEIPLVVTGHGPEVWARIERNRPLMIRMARLASIEEAETAPEGSITVALDDSALNLPLADVIDVGAETARLGKALGKLEKEIGQLQGKLGNEKFLAKAPEEEVAKQRERLTVAEGERARLAAARDRLAGLG
ncbi:MAG: valine--tRNA ligase [Pseudomonadota bacterium]